MINWLAGFSLLTLTCAAFADCEDYLKRNPDGTSVGVHRIESLGGSNVRLLDVSDSVRERRMPGDQRMNLLELKSLFEEGRPFLGFGFPNVYLAFPPEVNGKDDWDKFDAKSFKRADSQLVDTRGFVQSGILLVFKDMSPSKADRLYEAAKRHEGSRRITCVNANGCMMADAGITVGGESPSRYILPQTFLKDALAYGFEMDGEKLEFDVIRVNPEFLEQVGLRIDHAVGTTFCRHLERACATKSAAARNSLMVFAKKAGRRVAGLFLGQPRNRSDRRLLESAVVRMPPGDGEDIPYSLRVSEPSRLGSLLRLVWGPHSLFEMSLPPELVDAHLPDVLTPFPDPKPSFVTKVKKKVLFAEPVVKFLRGQLARTFKTFDGVLVSHLYGMLRTDSEKLPNKYNLVILGDRAVLIKISIRMKIVDWILSKHLIASGYIKDVRFAGEVAKAENGDILLNRNSGTYKPTEEQLKMAQQLLAKMFPGVNIRIVDHF